MTTWLWGAGKPLGGWPKLMRRAAGMGSQSQWYARLWLSLDGADVILQCTLDVGPCTMGPVMARGMMVQEATHPACKRCASRQKSCGQAGRVCGRCGTANKAAMWLPLRRRRWGRTARLPARPSDRTARRGQIKRWRGRERWKRGEGCRSCGSCSPPCICLLLANRPPALQRKRHCHAPPCQATGCRVHRPAACKLPDRQSRSHARSPFHGIGRGRDLRSARR